MGGQRSEHQRKVGRKWGIQPGPQFAKLVRTSWNSWVYDESLMISPHLDGLRGPKIYDAMGAPRKSTKKIPTTVRKIWGWVKSKWYLLRSTKGCFSIHSIWGPNKIWCVLHIWVRLKLGDIPKLQSFHRINNDKQSKCGIPGIPCFQSKSYAHVEIWYIAGYTNGVKNHGLPGDEAISTWRMPLWPLIHGKDDGTPWGLGDIPDIPHATYWFIIVTHDLP